jgi:hypothetical protein
MNVAFPPMSIGSVIAIIVLILAIILVIIGQLPLVVGALIAALALARLT